ncbi:DUF3592 domain-containing protein [Streptomyces sp. NPDC020883]|uniref:DUF3592 domain-containing protein n=1 Tax=Streptomyces sp. NPDC020883 TaxID=3365099 RepID=UPI0037A5448B
MGQCPGGTAADTAEPLRAARRGGGGGPGAHVSGRLFDARHRVHRPAGPTRQVPAPTTGTGLALGTHVPVAYLPERPKSARVFTRKYRLHRIVGLFFGAMIFLGVAAGCLLTR